MSTNSSAAFTLGKQLKDLKKNPIPGFVVNAKEDNIFEWEVGIIGPPNSPYQGGYFLSTMQFPQDYPFNPPTVTFNRPLFHPNVYIDGKVCISILHPPGDDPMSGETAVERWNPAQSVESVLLSIVSLMSDPNCSSPANVDAGKLFREDKEQYNNLILQQVEESKKDIPDDFIMPTTESDFMIKPPEENDAVDDEFWYDDEDEDYEDEEEDYDE